MAIPRNLGNLAPGIDTNGVLGVTKGGTGATSSAAAPFALKGANSDITSLTGLTTALSVGQGGTGSTTLTANNVLLGNGTSAVQAVAPGTTGNVLTSNGTTWTSAALVIPPAAGVLTAVASGALLDGSEVIVNTDGTVSAVSGQAGIDGSQFAIQASNILFEMSAAYNSVDNKVVVVYRNQNNSNFGTARVATVANLNDISFGTAVVFQSGLTTNTSTVYSPVANKIVIVYLDQTDTIRARVGTISGTNISFGDSVALTAGGQGSTNSIATAYDSVNDKIIVAFNNSNLSRGEARVGTISGTDISFGTVVTFNNANTPGISAAYDPVNNRTVFAYRNAANSNFGTAIVGTVSGTNISFGSPIVFTSTDTQFTASVYDPTNGRIVIAYPNYSSGQASTAIVGTVSGTSISFGTPVVFGSPSDRISMSFNSQANNISVVANSLATIGTVSGTSISFATSVAYASGSGGTQPVSVFNTTGNLPVIAYKSNSDGSGQMKVYRPVVTNLTAENYIGISNAAYANGATATIQIVGSVDDAQSGLTAGRRYFLRLDGTLSLTAGDPSVIAGTAVSATRLIIKG
jgi:hypothetical protein